MRLFIAVWPSGGVVEALSSLSRPAVAGLRWTSPSHWHVTLRFLGTMPDEIEPDEIEAVRAVAAVPIDDLGPVTAVAGPEVGRFGQRVLHVPVSGLETLAERVIEATSDLGEPPDPRPFHGHITLARAKGRRPVADLRTLAGQPFAADWPVREITVVASVGTGRAGGPAYEVVGRRALRT